jgi:hypothetical protein
MNSRAAVCLALLLGLGDVSVRSAFAVTRAANNVFGSYDKSPAQLTNGEIEGLDSDARRKKVQELHKS